MDTEPNHDWSRAVDDTTYNAILLTVPIHHQFLCVPERSLPVIGSALHVVNALVRRDLIPEPIHHGAQNRADVRCVPPVMITLTA
jgi:hypothetical protein